MQTETSEPYRIRLVVQRNSVAFEARWIEPEGQESKTFPLSLPLDARAKEDLRWYLEDYVGFVGAGDRVLAAEVEQKIKDWGRQLYESLFEHPEGARVHLRLKDASHAGRPVILTLGTDEPDVHIQPWEMLRDRRGPLVFQGVTIRRQLGGAGGAGRARRPRLALPLRVLMITSRPKDAGFIDPRNSIAPMLDALEALPQGHVMVDFCEPPTFRRLEEMIAEARKKRRPVHIVHFDGHGTFQPETGIGALAFERDEDSREFHAVTGSSLGDLLSRLEVPLVILEACRSSALCERPIFGSVAPALVQNGVGSVIAFSHSVHIEASKLLIQRFYAKLADGNTVARALEEARARMSDQPKRWLNLGPNPETVDLQDWFIPQLYQVGVGPALDSFQTDTSATAAATARSRADSLHGFPPPPMYRFHGRALELLELERAFRRHPALALTGMGGMGKTALAREAADWWLRTKRFDAAVFHSFEQKAGAERVIQVLGQALEGEDFNSRLAEEQWKTALALFRQQRVLLVWDNFESTLPEFQKGEDDDSPLLFGSNEQQRLRKLYCELTEGEPAGRILVTCRPQETKLPGIREILLKGLARPDSLHLLAAVLYQRNISSDRIGYERDAIDALLKTVDNHPLSISLVAPHLKTLTPPQIYQELHEDLDRFADASAEETRNRSLRASLAFSIRRLSEEALGVLPYLAWFEGGVFEKNLTLFAELNDVTWAGVRDELVAMALIRVEHFEWATMSYLRFHPTLPHWARQSEEAQKAGIGEEEAAEARFIWIYLNVGQAVEEAVHGAEPAAGIALMELEERNFRSAMSRAIRRGTRLEGPWMGTVLGKYLLLGGRQRERDNLAAWLRSQSPINSGLDEVACATSWQQATGLLSKGRASEAIAVVNDLILRLETEGLIEGQNTDFQIALGYSYLAKFYVELGRADLALEPSHRAIALLDKLPGRAAKTNLSSVLGHLSNAHRALGQFAEALAAAERVLELQQDLGGARDYAVALGLIADTLNAQGRYAEADVRYTDALGAASAAGDIGLQGTILRNHAGMLYEMNPRRTIELAKNALTLLQQVGDVEGEMGVCDLLGTAEKNRTNLDAAEAWYARSHELAEKRNDRFMLAANAQNVGILHQCRAEQAIDPEARIGYLKRAVSSIEESLARWQEMNNQVGAAFSYFQLGVLYRMLNELDRAEEYLWFLGATDFVAAEFLAQYWEASAALPAGNLKAAGWFRTVAIRRHSPLSAPHRQGVHRHRRLAGSRY